MKTAADEMAIAQSALLLSVAFMIFPPRTCMGSGIHGAIRESSDRVGRTPQTRSPRVGGVSGSALAVALSVAAGLAGAVQVAMMSQLGDRISIAGALAFATLFTALAAFVILLLVKRSLSARSPMRSASRGGCSSAA